MATSGTIGQTVIDVAKIIEHAFRRAGKSPADQTPDALEAAKDNLYFYLSQLVNNGVNLWTLEKNVFGTVLNADAYAMLPATVDVRDAYYRTLQYAAGGTATSSAGGNANNAFDLTLTDACTQTTPNGNISYQFTGNTNVCNVTLMCNGTQTYTPVWEYSFDNTTWTPVLQVPQTTFIGGQWYCWDIDSPVGAPYFRMRETGGGTLNVLQLGFNLILFEQKMARLNFNQYASLTNKTFPSRVVLQYWMDHQLPLNLIRIWPVSNFAFDQIVIWRTRQIQDVGSLSNTLELPQRWVESAITETARRLMLELPGADMKRYQMLKDEAAAATLLAQAEERDNSPIQLAPNISCYTR